MEEGTIAMTKPLQAMKAGLRSTVAREARILNLTSLSFVAC